MNFNIRELRIDETPPINLPLNTDPSKKQVEEFLKHGVCFIAEVIGKIIGVILLNQISSNKLEIKNISLADDYQDKGTGKELINFTINYAKQKNYSYICIVTGNSSINQLAIYQKCDFRIIDIDFDFFRNNHDDPIYENGIECRDMIRLQMEL